MTGGVYVERALFMIGDQNTGKSTQLRSMFLDWRLGNQGKIPTARNVQNTYALSNERWLYLRLTSPHEADESMDQFLEKCGKEMQPYKRLARRWNFAGALQPIATSALAGAPDVISGFASHFTPERVRVVILSPDRSNKVMAPVALQSLIALLRRAPGTEVMVVDATTRSGNGLLYADFFDFT